MIAGSMFDCRCINVYGQNYQVIVLCNSPPTPTPTPTKRGEQDLCFRLYNIGTWNMEAVARVSWFVGIVTVLLSRFSACINSSNAGSTPYCLALKADTYAQTHLKHNTLEQIAFRQDH
jgi:hypothetical protein